MFLLYFWNGNKKRKRREREGEGEEEEKEKGEKERKKERKGDRGEVKERERGEKGREGGVCVRECVRTKHLKYIFLKKNKDPNDSIKSIQSRPPTFKS